jgi:hypothetical protein
MSDLSELHSLLRQINDLFVAQEQRVEQATIARIMAAAKGTPITTAPSQDHLNGDGRKVRAPKGAADSFAKRVLAGRSMTWTEIEEAAKNNQENVSFSAVRKALDRGKGTSYRYEGRSWSLI